MRRRHIIGYSFACLALIVSAPAGIGAQGSPATWEWRTYGGDLASTRYAPLDQIDAANFKDLEVAWRFKTDNFGPFPEYKLEGTPLMVKGVVYTTAGTRRSGFGMKPSSLHSRRWSRRSSPRTPGAA